MVKLLAIVFLSISSTLISAQEFIIFGSITDAQTKKQLNNAQIDVFDYDNTLLQRIQSDAQGRFKSGKLNARQLNLVVQLDSFRTQSFTMQIPTGLSNTNLQVDVDLKRSYFPQPPEFAKTDPIEKPKVSNKEYVDTHTEVAAQVEKKPKPDLEPLLIQRTIESKAQRVDSSTEVEEEVNELSVPENQVDNKGIINQQSISSHFGIAFKVEPFKSSIPQITSDQSNDYWVRDNRYIFLVRGQFETNSEAEAWMEQQMRLDYPTAFVIEIKDGKRVK